MALAPPAEKDGFSYAGDAFYREASNLNRHRRATLPELKAHFNGKDASGDNNRPAHWYEAQLLHYGLPPSKVKGTAHKRLWDAVIKPGLAVPAHILKIEADLKKEWAKREREAKKVLKDSAAAKPAASAKGTKRKADQLSTATSVNVSVSGNGSNMVNVVVQTTQSVSKKAKTATRVSKAKKAAPAKSMAGTASSKKATAPQTARKTVTPMEKKTTTAMKKTPTAAKPAVRSPGKPKATPKQPGRAPFASGFAMSDSASHPNEAPPPYSEFDSRPVGASSTGKQKQQYHQSSPPSSSQARIGLLNGRYRVSCPMIELNFPEHDGDLGLIATLDGTNLWLKFDFGIADGMIKLARPGDYADTENPTAAFWRGEAMGRDHERRLYNIDTVHRVGPDNHVYFMGGGYIRGKLCFEDVELTFDADRLPGQSMTSEVSPSQARVEWAQLDEYADS